MNPAYQAAYYARHKERIQADQRAYRERTGRHRGTEVMHYRAMAYALLRERDGDLCGICHLPLAGKIAIDHVVQRCQGGDDSARNLRLTHWDCNRRRERRPWPNDG